MASQADLAILITGKDQAGAVLKNLNKEVNGLGETFSKVGQIAGGFLAANVIAGAGQKVTSFIGDSVRLASDLGESINAVQQIFGESANTILDWGKSNATAFGLSQRSFNQMATPMGAVLKNLGFSQDEVAKSTIDLTKRASDMASVFNTDVEDALAAINSALRGEANPIERYGVSVNEAAVQLRALADTGKDSAASLTLQEKAAARLSIIFAQTDAVAGDFANTSNQAANAARIQQARMEELQATIGTKLLPVQLAITQAKLAMVNAIVTHVIPALEELYAKHWPAISAAVEQASAFVNQHWGTITAVFAFVTDFVRTRIEGMILVIQSVVEIVSSVAALVSAIAHGEWQAAWNEIKDIASATVNLVIGSILAQFGNLPESLYNLGKQAGNRLLQGVKDGAGDIAQSVLTGAAGAVPGGSFVAGGLGRLFGRASGGPVSAGSPYIVGERGPEIFSPARSGYITPNHAMGGMVQNINVYVTGGILSNRELVEEIRKATVRGDFRGYLQAV